MTWFGPATKAFQPHRLPFCASISSTQSPELTYIYISINNTSPQILTAPYSLIGIQDISQCSHTIPELELIPATGYTILFANIVNISDVSLILQPCLFMVMLIQLMLGLLYLWTIWAQSSWSTVSFPGLFYRCGYRYRQCVSRRCAHWHFWRTWRAYSKFHRISRFYGVVNCRFIGGLDIDELVASTVGTIDWLLFLGLQNFFFFPLLSF